MLKPRNKRGIWRLPLAHAQLGGWVQSRDPDDILVTGVERTDFEHAFTVAELLLCDQMVPLISPSDLKAGRAPHRWRPARIDKSGVQFDDRDLMDAKFLDCYIQELTGDDLVYREEMAHAAGLVIPPTEGWRARTAVMADKLGPNYDLTRSVLISLSHPCGPEIKLTHQRRANRNSFEAGWYRKSLEGEISSGSS